jgi:hypothetical protein
MNGVGLALALDIEVATEKATKAVTAFAGRRR